MRCRVGELVGSGHIAHSIDVGVQRLQVGVGADGATGGDAQALQAVAVQPGHPAHGAQQFVKRQGGLLPLLSHHQGLHQGLDRSVGPGCSFTAQGRVAGQHLHALGPQRGCHQRRHLLVLAQQQARPLLHQRHLRAQPGKTLRQLAADRPAAQHQEPLRGRWQRGKTRPQGVTGHIAGLGQPRQRRHHRPGAGGNHDAAGAQPLRAAVGMLDLDRPGVAQGGVALHHLHAQAGVAGHAVVRGNGGDHALDALHHGREVDHGFKVLQAKAAGITHLLRHPGAFDQRLAGHTAVVQAVATHDLGLHQRHPGLDGRCDVGRDQPAGAGTDDDQVAVKAPGPLATPTCVHASPLQRQHHRLGQQGEQAQQGQCAEQARAGDVAQRADAGEFGAGIHVDRGAGQHTELADPVKGPGAQGGQAHGQVDDKKGHHRNQAQTEQIQRAVTRQPLVDAGQSLAKARLHRVTQHEARGQKGHGGAQRGGERHQQQAPA